MSHVSIQDTQGVLLLFLWSFAHQGLILRTFGAFVISYTLDFMWRPSSTFCFSWLCCSILNCCHCESVLLFNSCSSQFRLPRFPVITLSSSWGQQMLAAPSLSKLSARRFKKTFNLSWRSFCSTLNHSSQVSYCCCWVAQELFWCTKKSVSFKELKKKDITGDVWVFAKRLRDFYFFPHASWDPIVLLATFFFCETSHHF